MIKEIYLAGGCFWGLEQYFKKLHGIVFTEVGYANGKTENVTYEQVCKNDTGHTETVKVHYDDEKLGLPFLLEMFFAVINPTTLNKQGNDHGTQYRTGIYFIDPQDENIIKQSLAELQKHFAETVVVEVSPLLNYTKAENYHQAYLENNPQGYCHIDTRLLTKAAEARDPTKLYPVPSPKALAEKLTPLQYAVTQEASTETPFDNLYNANFAVGIYVDITSGEPLFYSTDKFESGCGWPAFSRPIDQHLINEHPDNTIGKKRIEVRSAHSNAHLGHVFKDGPKDLGGLRYCINSASLKFIPKNEMEKLGYGKYLIILDQHENSK